MSNIYQYYLNSFQDALRTRNLSERRIGAELKFPLVNYDGSACSLKKVEALWSYLQSRGWAPVIDEMTGKVVGAKRPGEKNDTVASCETGYCKTEFSLAHVSNLFDLEMSVRELIEELSRFAEMNKVSFLGYGIQPLTRPGKHLQVKKGRSSVWDKVFESNRYIAKEDGDDFHLFTVNAASHVHVSVLPDEAIPAVNVLNGFAGAQIALTANSNIWKGRIDPHYKCVSEKLWDWWMPDNGRTGVPKRPFRDMQAYIQTVAAFSPVFVFRSGKPIVLKNYQTFEEYFNHQNPSGFDMEGRKIQLKPEKTDFDLHCTCYWFNARISRYFTVENRVNDQQPPADIITIPALTLGLVSARAEAWEELSAYPWQTLHYTRAAACRKGLEATADSVKLSDLARKMLELAERGLKRRGLGEEKFLHPLRERIHNNKSPADEAEQLFKKGGITELVKKRKI
jgi:gamma-glutamylcysteine synthetase